MIRGKKSKYINYFVLQKIGRNLKSFNEITKNESMNLYEEIINANVLLIDDIFKIKNPTTKPSTRLGKFLTQDTWTQTQ